MADKRSRNGSGRVQQKATKAPAPARRRLDRRRLMVQILVAFLVLAMLMPIVAAFL